MHEYTNTTQIILQSPLQIDPKAKVSYQTQAEPKPRGPSQLVASGWEDVCPQANTMWLWTVLWSWSYYDGTCIVFFLIASKYGTKVIEKKTALKVQRITFISSWFHFYNLSEICIFFLEFILFLLLAHTQTQKWDKYLYKTPKQIVSWGLQEGKLSRCSRINHARSSQLWRTSQKRLKKQKTKQKPGVTPLPWMFFWYGMWKDQSP